MNKERLRVLYRKKRQALSEEDYAELNAKISFLFFREFSQFSGRIVHSFLPVKKRKEVDTWPIINHLVELGATVTVPKAHVDLLQLTSHIYGDQMSLKENEWGVPEPDDGEMMPAEEIDLILLPLLSFDEKGYRVGYGKGFYDRYLEKCKPEILKIGLSFFPSVHQIVGTDEFDVRMDYCITPEKIYQFQ